MLIRSPPNAVELERLSREVDQLVREGKWNKEQFERIRKLARIAAGEDLASYPGLLEFLYLHSDPTWA
jgi:hypothetical protein